MQGDVDPWQDFLNRKTKLADVVEGVSFVETLLLPRASDEARNLARFVRDDPRVQLVVNEAIEAVGRNDEPDYAKWFEEKPHLEPIWALARERVRVKRGDCADPFSEIRHDVAFQYTFHALEAAGRHKAMKGLLLEVHDYVLCWIESGEPPTRVNLRDPSAPIVLKYNRGVEGEPIHLPSGRIFMDITDADAVDCLAALTKRDEVLPETKARRLQSTSTKAYTAKTFQTIRLRFSDLKAVPRKNNKFWEPVYKATLAVALQNLQQADDRADRESIVNFLDRYYSNVGGSWQPGYRAKIKSFINSYKASAAEADKALNNLSPS